MSLSIIKYRRRSKSRWRPRVNSLECFLSIHRSIFPIQKSSFRLSTPVNLDTLLLCSPGEFEFTRKNCKQERKKKLETLDPLSKRDNVRVSNFIRMAADFHVARNPNRATDFNVAQSFDKVTGIYTGFTRKKKKREKKFKVYYYTRLSTNIFFDSREKNRMDKFFRTEIRGEGEGFSSKAEFYRAGRSIF